MKQKFRGVQDEAYALFQIKNNAYGEAYKNYGSVGILIRMGEKLNRYLSISNKKIEISGDEYLRDTLITSLPDNLKVGGNLGLGYTKIKSLPDTLTVNGWLDLRNSILSKKYTKEQLKQMLPGVEEDIYV